jgi:hypothetical protein
MSKGESAEERAAREKFKRWLQEAEAAAAELVEVGDLLFRGGEPSDPALVSPLPTGKGSGGATAWAERVAALQAAKIDNSRKH